MLVLFLIVVVTGVITPFFLEEKKKEMIIGYSFILGDILLLLAMICSNLAGIPGYGKGEAFLIGVCIIMLGVMGAKMHRILNPKKYTQGEKTHHQKEELQKLHHDHKAAS